MAGTVEQLCEDDSFLQSEYFRMFEFKVRRCPKAKPHDWTQCPFAHPTEKAKRRGPTKYKYNGTACADFRKNGSCRRGDACPFAHGVFEAWLHPARYRTKLCTDGEKCVRRVCFFASKDEQLREPTPEGLEPVIALRDELLENMRAEPHFTKQLDLLFALEPPATVEPQDEEMPAHPETVQGHATTLDLLRELELRAQQQPPQQYLGTPRRQLLSSLPQYPSQGLENELFQKMSMRQALREDMLAAQSTRMSLDMLGPSSSLGSVDAILARRLNSLPPLSPHQAIHPFANNWSGNDASNGLFSHGGLNTGSENQSRMSEDWMSINITPTNPSNRSSSDTVSPYHQFGHNGNGFNNYMVSSGQQQQQQQAQGGNMRLEDMLNTGSMSSNQSDAIGMRMQSNSLFNQQPLPFDHGMQMTGSAIEDGYGYQNFLPSQSQMPAGPSADQESFLAMLAHTQAHSSAGMFEAAALGDPQCQVPACSRTANISNKFALAPARLPSPGIDHSPSVDDMLREIPSNLADLA